MHGVPRRFDIVATYLFDIDISAVERLFNSRPGYHTPKQVARSIRRFVKEEAKRRAKEGR